jgi:hypothetical protein
VCTQQQQQQLLLLLLLLLLAGKELYSKLQTTATTELQNKYKPKTWQAQRGKKFKTSISLHTEDLHLLLLLLQNVNTNTHINKTEISQQDMSEECFISNET